MLKTPFGDVLPLEEIIQLDKKEQIAYQRLKIDPSLEIIQELLTDSQSLDVDFVFTLIKIDLIDEKLSAIMMGFTQFWDSAWKNLGKEVYGREFPLHPRLDSFTLLRGRALYIEYQLNSSDSLSHSTMQANDDVQRSYLWYAATRFHYYEAIDVLCWEMVYGKTANPKKNYDFILHLAMQAASFYLAPGLTLLAKIANSCATQLDAKDEQKKLRVYAIGYIATEQAKKKLPSSDDHIKIAYHFNSFQSENPYILSFDDAKQSIFNNMLSAQLHKKGKWRFFETHPPSLQEKRTKAKYYIDAVQKLQEGEEENSLPDSNPSLGN